MPRRVYIFITLLVAFGLGCTSPENRSPKNFKRVVTDEIGRRVEMVQEPQRIISLAPNITEILFALQLGERVVGVTTYCDYPPEAQTKPKIGDTIHPSLERVLGLKPDLVIASRVSQLEAFAHRLQEAGIPLYVVDTRSLTDVPRSLRRLGSLLGRAGQGEAVAQRMEQRMEQIQRRVQGLTTPKVLLVIQREPLMVPGTKSYLADLIRRAGGTLIGPEDAREGVTYSLESVIAQRPEIILWPGGESSSHRLEEINWPNLAETPAMRSRSVYSMDANLIMRPGPRLVDGLSEVARILHPEAFKP
jgi:iron complex transport system substrate-binding protein